MNERQATALLYLGIGIAALIALCVVAIVPFAVGAIAIEALSGGTKEGPKFGEAWLAGAFTIVLLLFCLFLLLGFGVWSVRFWTAALT